MATCQENPMAIENVVEKMLSYVDFTQLKELRFLNKMWREEATRRLLKTCYIRLPHFCVSMKPKNLKKWKNHLFQLLESGSSSSGNPFNFHHLHIRHPDVDIPIFKDLVRHRLAQGLENPGNFIQSLFYQGDLDSIIIKSQLQNLLKQLPNLQELICPELGTILSQNASFEPQLWLCTKMIIQFFIKAGKCHLLPEFAFTLLDEDEISAGEREDRIGVLEQLADAEPAVKFKELSFSVREDQDQENTKKANGALWKRLKEPLLKILEKSGNSLEKFKIGQPLCRTKNEAWKPEFPVLSNLKSVRICSLFWQEAPESESNVPIFPAEFQFSQNCPNLQNVQISIEHMDGDGVHFGGNSDGTGNGAGAGDSPNSNNWNSWTTLFPPNSIGSAPSVDSLSIYADFVNMSSVHRTFPNITSLILVNVADFSKMAPNIWRLFPKLKFLSVHILGCSVNNYYPFFESSLMGVTPGFVKILHETDGDILPPGAKLISVVEKQAPSILRMKDLTRLELTFNCMRFRTIPSDRPIFSPVVFRHLKRKGLKVSITVNVNDGKSQVNVEKMMQPLTSWCKVEVKSR